MEYKISPLRSQCLTTMTLIGYAAHYDLIRGPSNHKSPEYSMTAVQNRAALALADIARASELGFNTRSGIGCLLAAGKIGPAEMEAAARWLEDYALAEFGARDPDTRRGSNTPSPSGPSDARLFAATARRKACEHLGTALDHLLIAALADGLSPKEIAERTKQEQRFVAGKLAATLMVLAQHYTRADDSGRAH